ncbi:pseudaminic acid cytidylyltransferase [Chelativorans sp. ZYF759]|nr:pseudaminic acid cytidylyltransferase [Chelativorans sp. ZYF759]
MVNVAVIPARGGSKRIPGKNVKPFHGRPMLDYAIAAARSSSLFTDILVSSDDDKILAEAERLGATPLRRPVELSDDHTPTLPVIAHAISALDQELAESDLAVCCIYPCVPFLEPNYLQQARRELERHPTRFVFPVVEYPSPPQRALVRSDNGNLAPLFPGHAATRTQDLTAACYDAGQFYWAAAPTWLSTGSVHDNGIGLLIPSWRAVDIDTPEDWYRAELLYRTLNVPEPDPCAS